MVDLLLDSPKDNNSSTYNINQISTEKNASKYEADLLATMTSLRNQSRILNLERAELDRLRSEADKAGDDVRNQEAAIRESKASVRETRARCVASFLSTRVVTLSKNLKMRINFCCSKIFKTSIDLNIVCSRGRDISAARPSEGNCKALTPLTESKS
jgi:hypothetical protein